MSALRQACGPNRNDEQYGSRELPVRSRGSRSTSAWPTVHRLQSTSSTAITRPGKAAISVLSTALQHPRLLIRAVGPWAAVDLQTVVSEVGNPEFLDARLGVEGPMMFRSSSSDESATSTMRKISAGSGCRSDIAPRVAHQGDVRLRLTVGKANRDPDANDRPAGCARVRR